MRILGIDPDRGMGRLCAAALAAAVLVLIGAPSEAAAQSAWMSDRSRTQGPGFRVGDFELHPGIGVEIGYDSNLYYSSDSPPPTGVAPPLQDSGILRATAHLLFSTRTQQRRTEGEAGGGEGNQQAASQPSVTFQGGISGSFYTFFNDLDRTNMEVDANLGLTILPGRPFSIQITDDFGRSIRPFTENLGMVSYGRITNDAGLRLNFSTEGQLLQISAGYNFKLDFFEEPQFQFGNRFQHVLSLQETFRFLPQTAIIHRTQFTILDYFGPRSITALTPSVNSGFLLRTQVGINGAITNEFSVLAMVGYSAGFFDQSSAGSAYDQEYESLSAQVQARWRIEENTNLTFGYDRDFQPSFLGNFYRVDRGVAAFQTIIDGQFLLGVDASFGYYEFGAALASDGTTPVGSTSTRGDFRLISSIFAEYRFTDYLGVNGTLRYTGNFTDYAYVIPAAGAGTFLDPAQFNKFEAWLGVRLFY